MRALMQKHLELQEARREDGDKGFSLIELIIVVVILGILAAIAIPIFLNIQKDAEANSLDAIAGNAATQAAAAVAQSNDDWANVSNLNDDGQGISVSVTADTIAGAEATATTPADDVDMDTICATASKGDDPDTEAVEAGTTTGTAGDCDAG